MDTIIIGSKDKTRSPKLFCLFSLSILRRKTIQILLTYYTDKAWQIRHVGCDGINGTPHNEARIELETYGVQQMTKIYSNSWAFINAPNDRTNRLQSQNHLGDKRERLRLETHSLEVTNESAFWLIHKSILNPWVQLPALSIIWLLSNK